MPPKSMYPQQRVRRAHVVACKMCDYRPAEVLMGRVSAAPIALLAAGLEGSAAVLGRHCLLAAFRLACIVSVDLSCETKIEQSISTTKVRTTQVYRASTGNWYATRELVEQAANAWSSQLAKNETGANRLQLLDGRNRVDNKRC